MNISGSTIEDFKKSMREVMHEVFLNAAAKGFWEGDQNDGEKIALMHSELSEALESLRNGCPCSQKIAYGNLEEELADCVILIMDFAERHALDLPGAIVAKMSYNESRPSMHGKKF